MKSESYNSFNLKVLISKFPKIRVFIWANVDIERKYVAINLMLHYFLPTKGAALRRIITYATVNTLSSLPGELL